MMARGAWPSAPPVSRCSTHAWRLMAACVAVDWLAMGDREPDPGDGATCVSG